MAFTGKPTNPHDLILWDGTEFYSGKLTGDNIDPTSTQPIQVDGYLQGTYLALNNGSTIPTVVSGSGVPASTPANGSIFLRTNGTGRTGVYTFQNGSWSSIGISLEPLTLTALYIDPSNSSGLASDNNTGATISTPLLTTAYLNQILYARSLTGSTTITYMSDDASGVQLDYTSVYLAGFGLTFQGTPNILHTGGTLNGSTVAIDPSTNQRQLVGTSDVATFHPYIVSALSGAATDACLLVDTTGGNAGTSAWIVSGTSIASMSRPLTTSTTAGTFTSGDSYEIQRGSHLAVTQSMAVNNPSNISFFDFAFTTNHVGTEGVNYTRCSFAGTIESGGSYTNCFMNDVIEFTPIGSVFMVAGVWITTVNGEAICPISLTSDVYITGATLVIGPIDYANVWIDQDVGTFGGIQVHDMSGFGILVVGSTILGAYFNQSSDISVWGSGNARFGIGIGPGATVTTSAVPGNILVTGVLGDFAFLTNFDGYTTSARSWDEVGNAYNPNAATTWANFTNTSVFNFQAHDVQTSASIVGLPQTVGPNNSTGATVTLSGDVTGLSSANTVVKIQNKSLASSLNSIGSTQDGYVLTWVSIDNQWEAKPTTATVSSVTMGGDVTGSSSSATVIKVDGVSYPSSPSTNTVPVVTGSNVVTYQQIADAQVSATAAITGTKISPNFGSQNISTTGTLSSGATTLTSIRDTGLSTGIIHSDSSGNFTSSAVNLAGADVTGVLPTGNQVSQSLGGDLSGTTASATVIKLQGNTVQSGTLTSIDDGYVLTWVNSASMWEPKPLTTVTSVTMGGDISGNSSSATVVKVDGVSYPSSPSTNTVPVVTGSNIVTYQQIADAQISSTANIAVTKLATGIAGQFLQSNTTPAPTWTTLSGDGALGNTGALTIVNLTGSAGIVTVTPSTHLSFGTNPSTNGLINFPNSGSIQTLIGVRNAANTANVAFLRVDGTNNLFMGGGVQDGYVFIDAGPSQTVQLAINGVTEVSVSSTGTTISTLGTGIVHSSSVGLLSSSLVVNADISTSADMAVNKLAAGTSAQVLLNNSTPAPTWTTLSGDVTVGSTGTTTVIALDGYALPNPGNAGAFQSNGTTLSFAPINLASSTYVTGILPIANQAAQTMGGDVSGTTAATTVTKLQGNGVQSGTLSSTQDGYVLTWVNSASLWEAKPLTVVSSVTMGGDITGSSSSATVVKVDGVSYPASPSTNTVPVVTGSNTVTYQQIANAQISNIAAIAVSKLASGTAAQILLNNGTPTPTWTSISGDVSITSAGVTTVAKIDGYTLPSPTAGVLEEVGGVLQWGAVNLAGGSTYVSGNLPISNVASGTSAQVLMSNATPASTWTTFSGDITVGATGITTVGSIHSATVPIAGSLTTGNVLQVNGTSSLTYAPINLAGGSNFVSGVLPSANQAAQSAGRLFSLMGC